MRITTLLLLLLLLLLLSGATLQAQEYGFKFGSIGLSDLSARSYSLDTTAKAIVLNEFAHTELDNFTGKIIVNYHVRIKILKKDGLSYGNIEIPLRKVKERKETVSSITASTFYMKDNGMVESKWPGKGEFMENVNQYYDVKKFTMPEVKTGSIVEVMYIIESPFIFNYWPWEFQGDIPKLKSEIWAKIPGNYMYNMALKGPLKLTTNESSVITRCFEFGTSAADCALFKYGMVNIPAFKSEKYMTARSNFLSALNFELSTVKYFDGRVDKFTKEWKDVDLDLKNDENFGVQVKRARNMWEDEVKVIAMLEPDPLALAKKVYRLVVNHYRWNNENGKYSMDGVKKTYEAGKGSVGDINLSLIGALQAAKLRADPVILSTRSNGLPITVHPVLSDFNYVIAAVDINGERYLLDATEKFHPFGLLPDRCLNGQGRLLGESPAWINLLPREKRKRLTVLNLTLDSSGIFKGNMSISRYGYEAAEEREKIAGFSNATEYASKLAGEWGEGTSIEKVVFQDLDNPDKALTEQMEISLTGFDNMNAGTLYLDPFFTGKIGENPFKSEERFYPVDFGSPLERTLIVNLTYPAKFRLEEFPQNLSIGLPEGGGRFLFSINNMPNRVSISSNQIIAKTVFFPEEYPGLKEFYDRIIKVQSSVLVFKRKE